MEEVKVEPTDSRLEMDAPRIDGGILGRENASDVPMGPGASNGRSWNARRVAFDAGCGTAKQPSSDW